MRCQPVEKLQSKTKTIDYVKMEVRVFLVRCSLIVIKKSSHSLTHTDTNTAQLIVPDLSETAITNCN